MILMCFKLKLLNCENRAAFFVSSLDLIKLESPAHFASISNEKHFQNLEIFEINLGSSYGPVIQDL